MSFRPATSRAWRKALSIPSLTKWNVMPPFRYHGLRDSWVRTNTGVWNGASSGQLTSPSSNILFPMIYAPVLLKISSTQLVVRTCFPIISKFKEASKAPLKEQPIMDLKPAITKWVRWAFNPAINPSNDIPISKNTLLIFVVST